MRATQAAIALALAAVLAPMLGACATSTELPEAPPCVTPTPTPGTGSRTPRDNDFRYTRAVNEGAIKITRLTTDFRARWPDGKFSRRTEFREEFAIYAANVACAANALRDLKPTVTRYGEWDTRFDTVMGDYVSAMETGRESVRTRNVSDYRRFHRRMDAINTSLAEALLALP